MQKYFNRLISYQYLFEKQPGSPDLGFWKVLMVSAALVIIGGFIAWIMARRVKKDRLCSTYWNKVIAWCVTIGPVIYVLAFFRFQNAYWLSMRIFILLWLVLAALWMLFIIKYRFLTIPKRLRQREQQDQFNKYLPGKRR